MFVIERLFCALCNKILDTSVWPEDWKKSIFVTIPKVTGTLKCEFLPVKCRRGGDVSEGDLITGHRICSLIGQSHLGLLGYGSGESLQFV